MNEIDYVENVGGRTYVGVMTRDEDVAHEVASEVVACDDVEFDAYAYAGGVVVAFVRA